LAPLGSFLSVRKLKSKGKKSEIPMWNRAISAHWFTDFLKPIQCTEMDMVIKFDLNKIYRNDQKSLNENCVLTYEKHRHTYG
jgi:hypothetical protein